MSTSRSDLVKAKLLLLVYSGKQFLSDGVWVSCGDTLYKQYIMDDLVKEGHVVLENGVYKAQEHLGYLVDEWIK